MEMSWVWGLDSEYGSFPLGCTRGQDEGLNNPVSRHRSPVSLPPSPIPRRLRSDLSLSPVLCPPS